jgi:hypothetical protein
MSHPDDEIMKSIKFWVWSGLYTPTEVQSLIDGMLVDGADEEMLREAVEPEFNAKAEEEASWPAVTDCDRLDQAFDALNLHGIIALHNAGYEMSDGLEDVTEALETLGRKNFQGYCFYHFQDVEGAAVGEGLMIAFGALDDDETKKFGIGRLVQTVLEEVDLKVDWDGDPEERLDIPAFDWKRRRRAKRTLTLENRRAIQWPTSLDVGRAVDRMTTDDGPGFIVLEGRDQDYAQAAVNDGVFTVEWREVADDSFRHWKAGPPAGREELAVDDVAAILNAYRSDEPRPSAYAWQDISDMFG